MPIEDLLARHCGRGRMATVPLPRVAAAV